MRFPECPRSPCSNFDLIESGRTGHNAMCEANLPTALGREKRWWHDQNCKYFLNLVPCRGMSGDARKPNLWSPSRYTHYKKFWNTAVLLWNYTYYTCFSTFLVGKESFAAFYYIFYILHNILHMLELFGIINSKNEFVEKVRKLHVFLVK